MNLSATAFDLRDVGRRLWRDRLYTLTAVTTLALTLGATTAIFSVVNGVLLKPLTYQNPQELVVVREIFGPLTHLYPSVPVNPRHFDLWRTRATTFASLAELQATQMALTGLGEPREVSAVSTTAGLFDTLAVKPASGRPLTVADEQLGGADVVVVTDGFWRGPLGRDPRVLDRTLVLNGRPHAIVGVLGSDFNLPPQVGPLTRSLSNVDLLVPLRLNLSEYSQAGEFNNVALGRLRPGTSAEAANAELNVLDASIELPEKALLKAQVVPLFDTIVGPARRGLWLLLAAIGGVLLIACSNLANLSLTRAVTHLRDTAIRAALGAGRGRLAIRAVLEQTIIAATAGLLGLLVARAALAAFVRTAPIDLPRVTEVGLDGRVLAFAAVMSLAAGLLVAVLPASRIAGLDLERSLRAGSQALTADRGGVRIRAVLLAVQVGLSVTLLVATALLTVSFVRLSRLDLGFVATDVLTARVTLPQNRFSAAPARLRAFDQVLEAVGAVPGVEHVTWTSRLPLDGEDWVDIISPVGDPRPTWQMPIADFRFVGPDFFRTLTMPVRRGRAFTNNERDGGTTPALVSEATAARVWPGREALGQQFYRGDPVGKPIEVIGIVSDGRVVRLDAASPLMVYLPYWYRSRLTASLAIGTRLDPAAVVRPLRQAISSVDGDIVIADLRPMSDMPRAALSIPRYEMVLFTAFGCFALLIAIIGIYAVTTYSVARRRREMNLRVALGAESSHVRRLIVRQIAAPIGVGLAGGIAAALVCGQLGAAFLFGVQPRDPLVLMTVVAVVGVCGIVSTMVAASRGLAINPAAALRDD